MAARGIRRIRRMKNISPTLDMMGYGSVWNGRRHGQEAREYDPSEVE